MEIKGEQAILSCVKTLGRQTEKNEPHPIRSSSFELPATCQKLKK